MKILFLGCFCLIFSGIANSALEITVVNNSSATMKYSISGNASFLINGNFFATASGDKHDNSIRELKPGCEKTFLLAVAGEDSELFKKQPCYSGHLQVSSQKSVGYVWGHISNVKSGHVTFKYGKENDVASEYIPDPNNPKEMTHSTAMLANKALREGRFKTKFSALYEID